MSSKPSTLSRVRRTSAGSNPRNLGTGEPANADQCSPLLISPFTLTKPVKEEMQESFLGNITVYCMIPLLSPPSCCPPQVDSVLSADFHLLQKMLNALTAVKCQV